MIVFGNYCIAGNFRQRKFRQKRPSGSSSGIYFRQTSVIACLPLWSIVRLSLFCLSFIMNISDPTLVVLWKKISQEFYLVKNGFDESDEIKFLTKISCYTVLQAQNKLNSVLVIVHDHLLVTRVSELDTGGSTEKSVPGTVNHHSWGKNLMCDTALAVQKFLMNESSQTQEYEIFTRTEISAIAVFLSSFIGLVSVAVIFCDAPIFCSQVGSGPKVLSNDHRLLDNQGLPFTPSPSMQS